MFGKKLSMDKRTIFSKVVPAIAFGILLFFLFFPQTAIAADPAGTVLIIDDDNDVHFEDDESVDIFQSAFEDIGYDVKIEKSDETSDSTWSDYDIVVWSCGDDLTPIYDIPPNPEYKKMLVNYVTGGGYLILESGHIATWIKRFGDQAIDYELREKVLHATTDWVYCDVGNLTLSTQHPITTTPNALPDTIGFTPTNAGDDSGDADAVRILPNDVGVYNWSYVAYGGKPVKESVARIAYGLIAYDNDADVTNGGQVIYYAFDIDDIDNPDIQRELIENSANWLRGVPSPTPSRTLTPTSPTATTPVGAVLIIDDDNDVHFEDDQSVSIFQSAFTDIGYDVKIEKSDETSDSTWSDYDIVVWSCGDDLTPIYNPEYKKMLVDYVTGGGRLILESGHIATWIKRFGDQAIDYELRKKVLHATTDWVYCDVGNLILSTQHPITTTPNALPDTIGFTPTNPGDDSGDADTVRILPNSVGVLDWSSVAYNGNPVKESVAHISYGLIAYDNDVDVTNGGQIVYYAFDIDDIDNPDIQWKLIENSEHWLRREMPPIPTPEYPGFEIVFAIIGLLIAVYFIIRKRT